MRRGITRLAALMLALCLLAGCGAAQSGEGDGLRLYYPVPLEEHPGGDAISSVTVDWDTLPQEDRAAQAEAVLALLMGGCQEERFQSPVPSGTSLRSVEVKGGTAWVDFSGSYSQLSGMALTIADYCVALSLTQLEGVYAVRITVNGQELAYRDSNLFLASDVLLTSMDDVVRMLTAQLYFPDADGTLTPEERLLPQYEGQSTADVVIAALMDGPTEDGLQALIPEGVTGITARVEDGVCQLNLPSEELDAVDADTVEQMLRGIVTSLRSLEGITAVQVYRDGTYVEVYE